MYISGFRIDPITLIRVSDWKDLFLIAIFVKGVDFSKKGQRRSRPVTASPLSLLHSISQEVKEVFNFPSLHTPFSLFSTLVGGFSLI